MVVKTTKIFTPDDLLTMPEGDRYELVDGQLVERNVSALSSLVAGKMSTKLDIFVEPLKVGWVFPDNTSFQCFPDEPLKVRKVDTAFVAVARMSLEDIKSEGHIHIAPDLAVEVLSPNDLAYEVNAKIEEWLSAGVKLVWVIDPEAKKVQVHRADGSISKLGMNDELSGESVISGFRCRVSELIP